MRSAIKEYIEPSSKEKQELWEKAIFVFDTNVLLNLYRYSAKTRNSLLDAFQSFRDRVWIPYQVAYEYMRKRCEVIYETVQRYDQFKKEILIRRLILCVSLQVTMRFQTSKDTSLNGWIAIKIGTY